MSDFKPSKVTGDLGVTIDQINTNNAVLVTGEVTDVSADTETTIATVPANGLKYITKIICTGVENARWDVYIDSTRKMTKRTMSNRERGKSVVTMRPYETERIKVHCHWIWKGTNVRSTLGIGCTCK